MKILRFVAAVATTLALPRRLFETLLNRLRDGGLLVTTEPDGLLVPGHDLEALTVGRVVAVMRSAPGPEPKIARPPVM